MRIIRISRNRLSRLAKRIRAQKVLDAKHVELRQRMAAAEARIERANRDKLSPDEYEQYLFSREAYYEVYRQRWSELRSSMPHSTLAEKFKIADRASAWARGVTGFLN
ncbi:MAG: hypothetical protein N0E58_08970 [Candidatus Thiodiazotropha endolucinida]|uniref:Uncharacterized protein n=1 Tax=Candidatus Thiodiazotropha taylori TaxID=2792791 RepID=A0A9E4NK29_9GAMM|nr:hypothetical protein [Candidatus Thiodiazotropha taylori]MCW4236385.1 hypothetical protein [Candidatus Thiodiazotropha endolucinida]